MLSDITREFPHAAFTPADRATETLPHAIPALPATRR